MQWLGVLWQSPQWLWLLSALALPLLIHLWRRNKTQEITFAAAHWLKKDLQKQYRRLQLHNYWLLLLRLLIIILLALLLAKPFLKHETTAIFKEPLLLVDPRIETAQLQTFLDDALPQLNATPERVFWLQAKPIGIDETRPPAAENWRALSNLADQPNFRHAHILLNNAINPSGHNALTISPHWQWHALHKASAEKPALPRIAIIGKRPDWLAPLFKALQAKLPKLRLQSLEANVAPSAKTIDWLIYNRAEILPDKLLTFVRTGGLLISDPRLQPSAALEFVNLQSASSPIANAAAIGRGSWLRYEHSWDHKDFFDHLDLPQRLWQQWVNQDWVLQHNNRGSWSIDAPPASIIHDSLVQTSRYEGVQKLLLISLLLLLTLERILALALPLIRKPRQNG
ncbi:MAG: BatA domain-containing protein [Gammaproteobacteria bacterium]|nr:BatA domain-containing protein [Gammaproteobacteria bacterium]